MTKAYPFAWGLGAVAVLAALAPHIACLAATALLLCGVSLTAIHPALTPEALADAHALGLSVYDYVSQFCLTLRS